MGISIQITGSITCPYCLKEQFIYTQTKALPRYEHSYTVGSHIIGGPFLNYHQFCSDETCKYCDTDFVPFLKINENSINEINACKLEDYSDDYSIKYDCNDVSEETLIMFIKWNTISVILMSKNLNDIWKSLNGIDVYTWMDDYWALQKIINLLLIKYPSSRDHFFKTVFNDLENSLDVKYIDRVNIDFLVYLEKKDFRMTIPQNNKKKIYNQIEYNDSFDILKDEIMNNKEILQKIIIADDNIHFNI